jgi:MoaA/NifB/PqqE/SkfB family radical SAM enzyme
MRIRIDRDANYRAIFNEGKTLRLRIDPTKPIGTPKTAEIEDVAINNKCFANCSYCYTSATKHGQNFDNILEKARNVWGFKDENERPFQIAIGGAGEPTIHPGFIAFLKEVHDLGIVPNYTTNGMHLSNDDIEATRKYCGGVAVSYHPHIKNVFTKAIHKLKDATRLNAHVIVGDRKSYADLQSIYETFKDDLEYIVVLPYQAAGRGVAINTHETWIETFRWIAGLPEDRQQQFAFGALFYPWMLENKVPLDIDIYEPEIYSGYRIFDDSYRILRKSSYDLTPKFDTQHDTQ